MAHPSLGPAVPASPLVRAALRHRPCPPWRCCLLPLLPTSSCSRQQQQHGKQAITGVRVSSDKGLPCCWLFHTAHSHWQLLAAFPVQSALWGCTVFTINSCSSTCCAAREIPEPGSIRTVGWQGLWQHATSPPVVRPDHKQNAIRYIILRAASSSNCILPLCDIQLGSQTVHTDAPVDFPGVSCCPLWPSRQVILIYILEKVQPASAVCLVILPAPVCIYKRLICHLGLLELLICVVLQATESQAAVLHNSCEGHHAPEHRTALLQQQALLQCCF